MFQFFTSFAASSAFEKHRLEVTAKTYDAPADHALRSIANTFSGLDPETKSQIAFATILKKLLTSDSRTHWLYLLKNLIILDRVLEDGLFADELADLALPTLDNFRETDPRYAPLNTEAIIAAFWKLVREKSSALRSKQHVFCHKRSHRNEFLSRLSLGELLRQMQSLEGFFAMTYEFVGCLEGRGGGKEREEWARSKLMEYLCLQVLHKLMLYYSCQLQCNQAFLLALTRQPERAREEDIRRFKKLIAKFKLNADQYIRFVEQRKAIKGFEVVNYKELNPYEIEPILKLLDQLILQNAAAQRPIFETLVVPEDQMRVEKKPFANLNTDVLIARVKQRGREGEGKEEGNAFSNWVNSFSSSFPQNEVLSVDLILELKREEEENRESCEVVDDSSRDSCIYNNRDTNVSANYSIDQQLWHKQPTPPLPFNNLYSQLHPNWNH